MSKLHADGPQVVERRSYTFRRLGGAVPALVLFLLAGSLLAGGWEAVTTAPEADLHQVVSLDSDEEGCVESDTVICLLDGRYAVTLDWETANGQTGAAKVARPRTSDSGLFYFFDRNNWEVLVKVLDGCGTPNRAHWVYAAVASDVGMKLVVRDTTLPDYDADGNRTMNYREYTAKPLERRSQRPDESDEEYETNVLAKGHPALTESNAFPHACEEEA